MKYIAAVYKYTSFPIAKKTVHLTTIYIYLKANVISCHVTVIVIVM